METPWKVIAAFVGVFVAGAVFGGFFVVGVGRHGAPEAPAVVVPPPAAAVVTTSTPTPVAASAAAPAASAPEAGNPQRLAASQMPLYVQTPQLLRRYAETLNLTPEQKENITPRLHRATEDFRRLWQNYLRETGIVVGRLQEDMRKELTPEQITKLEAWEKRQKEALEKAAQRDQKKAGGNKMPGLNRPANKATPKAGATGASGSSSTAAESTPPPMVEVQPEKKE